LGHVLPDHSDRWWTITSEAALPSVASEIPSALANWGIPALDAIDSSTALAAIWRSGRSPGLTDFERARYLDELDGDSAQQPGKDASGK
jgi:hypothetical protein